MGLLRLVTNIDAGDVGTLVVGWELKYWMDLPSETHPDNPIQSLEEYREVESIGYVELHIYDKVGVMITHSYTRNKKIREILEKQLLEIIANQSIEELKN